MSPEEEEEEGQQRGNENGDEQHLTFQDPFDYELQEHPFTFSFHRNYRT